MRNSSSKKQAAGLDDRDPNRERDRGGHDVARYSDCPSVRWVMQAGLGEADDNGVQGLARLRGDPMRNPANAIAAGQMMSADPG